ncbi:zinc-containing alcohol dehydrogenase superfamily protein [Pseudomonas sp. M47T1]|nr:zinc-containing alcohol dehydrogenase superfamily protein [Pseudomonas sp. M47T1]
MPAIPLPSTMTYIEITTPGGPEVLQPRTGPLPVAQAHELLIKVHAAGVNRPDALQRAGKYPMQPGMNPLPGLEVAGEIVALGAEVKGFALGDRVCALTNGGGYAEYATVPATQVLPIPAGIDMVSAAAIPETFFTVWANLFDMAHLGAEESVLIHGGTSGIGTTALSLCRALGIKAFATAGSSEKCEQIRQLGGEPINYREQDFAKVIAERTGGKGVDVILDIMGGPYFEPNVASLARRGRLVVIGFLGSPTVKEANLLAIMAKQAVVTGSLLRSRSTEEKAVIAAGLERHVWPLLAEGKCPPVLDQVFPLADAAGAHRRMEGGDHVGKIVLKVI